MFTTELSTPPASAGERLQHFAGAAFHRFVEMWRAARNRRSVAKLLEWDEHMLRDIGLTQSDVRSAMALPAGGDPSDRLMLAQHERRDALHAVAREDISRSRKAQRRTLPTHTYPVLDL